MGGAREQGDVGWGALHSRPSTAAGCAAAANTAQARDKSGLETSQDSTALLCLSHTHSVFHSPGRRGHRNQKRNSRAIRPPLEARAAGLSFDGEGDQRVRQKLSAGSCGLGPAVRAVDRRVTSVPKVEPSSIRKPHEIRGMGRDVLLRGGRGGSRRIEQERDLIL